MAYPAGTLNLKQVKDGIHDWVAEVTDGVITSDRIIWRQQGRPLPQRPCVTLKIIEGPSNTDRDASLLFKPLPGVPPSGKRIPPQKQTFTHGMQMEMTVSVQVFGSTKHAPDISALQLSLDLNSSLFRQSILDKLKKSGVSIQGGRRSVRNLTALEESDYEERAGFDIEMGLVQNIADNPGTIEEMNLEVETSEGTDTRNIDLVNT